MRKGTVILGATLAFLWALAIFLPRADSQLPSQIELACPQGSSPMQNIGQTFNQSTGKYRQWLCVDVNGNITQAVGASGTVGATGVYLAQSCAGSISPCIQIPASGGCYGAANGTSTVSVTAGSPIVTFSGGFPNPVPQVGQEAWVNLERGGQQVAALKGNLCQTLFANQIASDGWSETTYLGKRFSAGGTPVTITAVDPGAGTVTVSQNASITGNTSAVFFYGPNIYSQMQQACRSGNGIDGLSGASVHLATGFYVLDNGGQPESACGCVQSPASNCVSTGGVNYTFGQLSGEGATVTALFTPPWYDHEGDLGTVLAGGILHDITIDGAWVGVANTIARGTVFDGGAGGSYNFNIIGFNMGNGNNSETLYAGQFGTFTNFTISTGNRGIVVGSFELLNGTIQSASVPILQVSSGTITQPNTITGGFYLSGGIATSGGTLGAVINRESSVTATGDVYRLQHTDFCQLGNNPAIIDPESSGELRLVNARINSSPLCTPGTNAGGIQIASGVALRMTQSSVLAAGTGNTLTVPAGASYFDNCGNTISGGAGASIGGSVFGNCSVIGSIPATGNFALTNATFTSVIGTDQKHFTLNITASAAAAITITYTFPAPFLVAPGSCHAQDVGGTNPLLTFSTSVAPTTTAVTFLSSAAAVNTDTLQVAIDCQ